MRAAVGKGTPSRQQRGFLECHEARPCDLRVELVGRLGACTMSSSRILRRQGLRLARGVPVVDWEPLHCVPLCRPQTRHTACVMPRTRRDQDAACRSEVERLRGSRQDIYHTARWGAQNHSKGRGVKSKVFSGLSDSDRPDIWLRFAATCSMKVWSQLHNPPSSFAWYRGRRGG